MTLSVLTILKGFQLNVVKRNLELLNSVYENNHSFDARRVVVSPTGSGKTLMMTATILSGLNMHSDSCYVWITHNKQISKQTSEGLHSEIASFICTVDDIEAGAYSSARVLLFNVQKGLSKNANIWLKNWIQKQSNLGRKCVFIIDEADEGQSGLNMQSLRTILNPKLELGFTASFKSGVGDILYHRVEYSKVVEAELIVDNIYYEVSSEVAVKEMIKKAIDKRNRLEGLANILRGTKDYFVPKLAIQTNASKAEEMKALLVELLDLDIKDANNQIKIHTQYSRELDHTDLNEVRYIIGDLMIERGWDLPELCVLVATKDSMSIAKGVQLLGRVMRLPNGKRFTEEELEPLNAGYIYISGKHSIQKSCEEFMAQGFTPISGDPLGIEIETVYRRDDIALPNIETTRGELVSSVWSGDYDNIIDQCIENIIKLLGNMSESSPTIRVGSLNLEATSHNPTSIDKIEAEWNYEHTKDILRNALAVHFHRSLCELIVGEFHAEVLRKGMKITELSGKLKEASLIIKKSQLFRRLSLRVAITRFQFEWPISINIVKRRALSYSRNIFSKISGLNSQEEEFATKLNKVCEDNDWYWFRNTPSDILVVKSGYPDFVVFKGNKYVFIEYKGVHLVNSDQSTLKNALGMMGVGNYYMIYKKDSDDDKYFAKGVHNNDEEEFNFTSHLRIYL